MRTRLPLLIALAAAMPLGCVDSEVVGVLFGPKEGDAADDATIDADADAPPVDAEDAEDADVDLRCSSDLDCQALPLPPGEPCARLACNLALGRCEPAPVPGCCLTDADCPQGEPSCTRWACPAPGGQCVPVDTCAPCQSDLECAAQAPACHSATCLPMGCVFVPYPEGTCCDGDAACDDGDGCTRDVCQSGVCTFVDEPMPGCCDAPPVLRTSFSPAPPIAVTGAAHARWHVATAPATPSPPAVLALTHPETLVLGPPGQTVKSSATFDLGVVAPGTYRVRFQVLADLRPGDGVDQLLVLAHLGDSATPVVLHRKQDGPLGSWFVVERTFDVPQATPLFLELRYDAILPLDGLHTGVLVDDLDVRPACMQPPVCQVASDCTPKGCSQAACVQGQCHYEPLEGCCTSDLECAVDALCAEGRCVNGVCLVQPLPSCCDGPDCCQPVVLEQTFDQGLNGWTLANGHPQVGWHLVDAPDGLAPSAPTVLYYGRPGAFDYAAEIPTQGTAWSPAFTVPAGAATVTLAFWLIADVEQGTAFDVIEVLAKPVDGASAAPVWQKPATLAMGQWHLVKADLTGFAGQTVQLGFRFDSVDAVANGSFGLAIDSVSVTAECQAPPCTTHAQCPGGPCAQGVCLEGQCQTVPLPGCCETAQDCADGDPCTQDVCDAATGLCAHPPAPGCCANDAQCDDGDACTVDVCQLGVGPSGVAGQCAHLPAPGCCSSHAQCDDGQPCTADLCVAGQCTSQPIPGCCASGLDCQDGDPCTVDACVNGQCQWSQAPGCCQAAADCNDGDPCTQDVCAPGGCQHLPVPGCCSGPAGCNDANPCTLDTCDTATGLCSFTPIPGCCQTAADCDDGNKCTTDQCVAGQCRHQLDVNCCKEAADCDDGNPCTLDTCLTVGPFGICQHQGHGGPGCCQTASDCAADACAQAACVAFQCQQQPLPGCCQSDAACDDGDPCTVDACVGGVCQSTPGPGCCQSDADCDDGDPCTAETCDPTTGLCLVVPGLGCCASDAACDDGDPCTQDVCDALTGQCQHVASGACCALHADCDDGDPCTKDVCDASGACRHNPIAGCCGGHADCDDGNACTTDLCVNGVCKHEVNIFCCQSDAQCDDGNPCTQDVCFTFQQFGICQHLPVSGPGCCASDAHCQAPCQIGKCKQFLCEYQPSPSCCATDAECEEGDPCTQDLCVGGQCVHQPMPGCCASSAQCDDGDPCTADLCGPGGTCQHPPIPNCCQSSADCNDGDPCTADGCDVAAGQCVFKPLPGCCASLAQCDDGDPCTADTCDAASGQCQHAPEPSCCAPVEAARYTFDPADGQATLEGWTITPAPVGNAVSWWVSGKRAVSPPNALYMGNPVTGHYALPNAAPKATARTPVISLPERPFVLLTFRVRLAIESVSTYDRFFIRVVPADGQAAQTVWTKGAIPVAEYETWATAQADLTAWAGQDVQLELVFDAVDSLMNGTEGIHVDNLRVLGLCVAPGSCQSAADCDDGDACTADACVGSVCHHEAQPGCCETDLACDDGDPCTKDACVGGMCQHAFSPVPSCCQPKTWFEADFTAGTLDDFIVTADGGTAKWHPSSARSWSPPFALYYGVPSQGNYDTGTRNFGTATSPALPVPADAHTPTLRFRVWLDVEQAPARDRFYARVNLGGTLLNLWSKQLLADADYGKWVTVSVPLPSAAKGQWIKVLFEFDTVTDADNDGEGVYIDDVQILDTCGGP